MSLFCFVCLFVASSWYDLSLHVGCGSSSSDTRREALNLLYKVYTPIQVHGMYWFK